MSPALFMASFAPWETEKKKEEPIWARPKTRFTRAAERRRPTWRTRRTSKAPPKKATSGAEAMGMRTFCSVEPTFTAPTPAAAMPPPMRAPTRTWVSEMGIPRM